MKVCLFGSYVKDSYGIPSGNGGELLKKILKKQKVEVIECHDPLKRYYSILSSYINLLSKHKKISYDVMVIPWRGIITLPLAKLIHKGPIVYFPAFSIYDTLVNDRKWVKPNSIKARFVHFADKLACKWSDMVALESTEEINYFVTEFGLPKEKFFQLPLSADESVFYPVPNSNPNQTFEVLFFGSFIPLHGVHTIIKAAKILSGKDVFFSFCGDGQTKPEIEQFAKQNDIKNVEFLGIIPKEQLIDKIKNADVCLGIFGDTLKAQKVLTNKAFQILASKKPLITRDSPTAKEAHLESEKNCMLVPPADPDALAEAILHLKDNPDTCQLVANNGYETYRNHLSMNIAGKRLVEIMQSLISK